MMKKIRDFTIITVVTLILLEIALQVWFGVIQTSNSSHSQVEHIFQLEEKGFTLAPDFVWKNKQFEIKTNSLGMPWKEINQQKEEGVKRIGFFGDSFTAGAWATDYKYSFVGVVADKLKDENIEVLNFGVNSYGLDDIYYRIKNTAERFDLDHIVVCSFNGNDYRDTYLGFEVDSISDNGLYFFKRRVQEKKIPEPFLPPKRTANQDIERSDNHFEFKTPKLVNAWIERFNQKHTLTDFNVSDNFMSFTFWNRVDQPQVHTDAVYKTIAYTDSIHFYLDSLNKPLYVVTIPTMEQVYVQAPTGSNYDIEYPQRFLRDHAKATHIPYLDLLPSLRKHAQSENSTFLYVQADPHFNNQGHLLAGEQIESFIRAQLEMAEHKKGF